MLFGDDIDFRHRAAQIDLAGFPAMIFMLRRAGRGTSAFNRARQAATLMASGGRRSSSRWLNTARPPAPWPPARARRRRTGRCRAGLRPLGRPRLPGRPVGTEVSSRGPHLHVAEACEVIAAHRRRRAVLDVVRQRSGTHFDPEIAALVSTDPESLFEDLDGDTSTSCSPPSRWRGRR